MSAVCVNACHRKQLYKPRSFCRMLFNNLYLTTQACAFALIMSTGVCTQQPYLVCGQSKANGLTLKLPGGQVLADCAALHQLGHRHQQQQPGSSSWRRKQSGKVPQHEATAGPTKPVQQTQLCRLVDRHHSCSCLSHTCVAPSSTYAWE